MRHAPSCCGFMHAADETVAGIGDNVGTCRSEWRPPQPPRPGALCVGWDPPPGPHQRRSGRFGAAQRSVLDVLRSCLWQHA